MAAKAPESESDLSQQINALVEKQPGDHVKTVHVGGSNYRCNWWVVQSSLGYDNPNMRGGQLATTYRVRKSRFLRVTPSDQGLKIIEMPCNRKSGE